MLFLPENIPVIFAVNYFLRDKNRVFLNDKVDKSIWLKWMELRVHDDVEAIETPIGFIPIYDDLRILFKEVLGKQYSKEDYEKQFMIRVPELLAKINRVRNIYRRIDNIPKILFEELYLEEKRLRNVKEKFGEYVSPFSFL